MISFSPIWAIVLRHARMWRRDLNLLLGTFYWPMLDILIWGFLGSWIQQSQLVGFKNYEMVALLGILLWQFVGRGCNIIMIAFNEELWSYNIVNLFSLPLRIRDWIIGIILFYAFTMVLTTIFGIVVCALFYTIPMGEFIYTMLIFTPPLCLAGIWIGFTCLQIVVLLGKRGAELGFVVGWFFLPFSGAYYPVDVLPYWGQMLSYCLPMSYVFKGMRSYLMYNQDPTPYLIKGYVLGIIYAIAAILLFVYCFNRTKQKGIARLVD
ncbi:MAG TPA: ABC transporter permease [Candidatus Babeliales bacterium]|nr:ABC transporter permease [Candidatus Babeliales bacterium]